MAASVTAPSVIKTAMIESLYKAGWLQQQGQNGRWRGWTWFVCDDSKVGRTSH